MDTILMLKTALDKWFASEEGKKCCYGSASGDFLHNRLECAFLAGAGLGETITKAKMREELKQALAGLLNG